MTEIYRACIKVEDMTVLSCLLRRYTFGAPLYSNEEARGGSAWGAGTLTNGDGSRQPSKLELDFAEFQVKH